MPFAGGSAGPGAAANAFINPNANYGMNNIIANLPSGPNGTNPFMSPGLGNPSIGAPTFGGGGASPGSMFPPALPSGFGGPPQSAFGVQQPALGMQQPNVSMFAGGGSTGGQTPDQWLVQNQGSPVTAQPAWQAAIAAQQRNLQENFANLNEAFGAGGNRFSTAYGTAATDYWNQAGLNQNALLAQMQYQSLSDAANRYQSGMQQLSGQGFQSQMQQSALDAQSQMQQYGIGANMANSLFGAGVGGAQGLAGYGAQGAQGLQQGALMGMQGLFGAETQGGLSAAMQSLALQQMLQQGGMGLGNLWNTNLGLGGQLAGQQYGYNQAAISNAYQEWLRQQPQYNPMMSYLAQTASAYPYMMMPGYQPGQFGQMLGGLGGLLGGIGGLVSDIRVKENLWPVETDLGRDTNLQAYHFNYKGDQAPRIGFIAQEVARKYPWAVESVVDDLLAVDYGKLAMVAMLKGGEA